MTKKSYITDLMNHTKEPINLVEVDGSPLDVLEPGATLRFESVNPRTMYARWSHVAFKRDGTVGFTTRSDWREPERGRWVLHLLNQDGAEIEWRQCGEERICLPKGIPVIVTCPLRSDLIKFRSLTIVSKKILVQSDQHAGYCASRWILFDEKKPRPDNELQAVKKIIADLSKRKDVEHVEL